MAKSFKISIIGSGNVAWHLAQALENAGHLIKEIWSRKPENAEELADHLYDAQVQPDLDFSKSEATLFIVAVTDSAIADVASQLMLPPDVVLAHTSGAVPMEALSSAANHIGVFYPLQTFSKNKKVDFAEIPFCLEASTRKGSKVLESVAESLSSLIYHLNSNDRKVLHVAAVFACNFTNHMLKISQDILIRQHIDFDILHPLIAETINKGMELGPEKAQTGPAIRGDFNTIKNHLEILQEEPQVAELYKAISENIITDYLKHL